MSKISINSQYDLNEVISDTSIDGTLVVFYEMLQTATDQYSDKRIEQMRDTLKFVIEDSPELYKSDKNVEELSKLEVLYYYSLLPQYKFKKSNKMKKLILYTLLGVLLILAGNIWCYLENQRPLYPITNTCFVLTILHFLIPKYHNLKTPKLQRVVEIIKILEENLKSFTV